MGEVDISIIAQRLTNLRKHLGERRGEKLTIQDIAAKAQIPEHKMMRLEHGKGTSESLISLLLYYRTQGYNLDWILCPDNINIPMILASGEVLLVISEMIQKLSSRLHQDYSAINAQLKELGYSPLEDKHFAPSGAGLPEVFDFSS